MTCEGKCQDNTLKYNIMENVSFFYTIYKHIPQNVSLVNMFPIVRLSIFNIQTS